MVSNSYAFMLWNRTPWHFKSKSFGKWYAYAVINMILCETWTDQTTCRKMENHRRERFVPVHGFFPAFTKFSWTIACRMMMKILTQSDSFEIEVHYGFGPSWKYTPFLKYYRGFRLQLSFVNCDLFLNIFNNSCYSPFVYALENYIQLSDIEQLLSRFQDLLPRNPCTKPLYFKLKKTEK